MSVPEFSTQTTDDVAIGVPPCDVLRVGDSLEKKFGWDIQEDDSCEWTPADFTGYIPTAVVLDINDVVLENMGVIPNPGDATGDFIVTLKPDQTTAALRDAAVRWSLTIELGSIKKTLIYARFLIT